MSSFPAFREAVIPVVLDGFIDAVFCESVDLLPLSVLLKKVPEDQDRGLTRDPVGHWIDAG